MSLSKDLKNIREHGGASVAELSEFVAKMKGRSPQEVLGLVAGSNLIQATIQATVMTFLFIAVFTVFPYFYYGPVKPAETAAKPADKQAAPAADPNKKTENPAAAPANATGSQTTANTASGEAPKTDAEKAAKAMGMDEVKPADAKKNPLEKNLDNLLDNLK